MIEEKSRVPNPQRYELLDVYGIVVGNHPTAADAAKHAKIRWPDQEQDPERTGKGWDIQVVGAER